MYPSSFVGNQSRSDRCSSPGGASEWAAPSVQRQQPSVKTTRHHLYQQQGLPLSLSLGAVYLVGSAKQVDRKPGESGRRVGMGERCAQARPANRLYARVGATVVFAPRVQGAGWWCHVAHVIAVSGKRLKISEMNFYGVRRPVALAR
jgi:hypothetical protein